VFRLLTAKNGFGADGTRMDITKDLKKKKNSILKLPTKE
jgi:hypothetical protein